MQDWIRGVNIGGWLVLERFITPYLFAITDCHVTGNFCYYPGQVDAPPHSNEKYCDLFKCKPHRFPSVSGAIDYPTDEYTLMQSFASPDIARKYLDQHYENFVTQDDVKTLHEHGVTHVRVPLGHWILGTDEENAPFVTAHGWLYLVRFVGWCREYKIQVWPDLHTAPGSQNGFDNSGHLLPGNPTCHNWSSNQTLVQNTLNKLLRIAAQIRDDGLTDVITGIGILNEPFVDCNRTVVRDYSRKALQGIRSILGPDTSVYLGDMFNATKWNDGWWLNETNTFLDSHYYHVFAEEPRALSPRQHIAYVCRKNHRDTVSCCYEDAPKQTIPSEGISRIIGEWSASFDTLVVAKLDTIMTSIAEHQVAIEMERELSPDRKEFLRHFVEAQMVTYEAAALTGLSRGWFFWTLKTEGGAFAEWDFLRGLREGWIPSIPPSNVSSVDLYGTCEEIIMSTKDDMSFVDIFPDPATLQHQANWQGVKIDDDLVVSHGASLNANHDHVSPAPTPGFHQPYNSREKSKEVQASSNIILTTIPYSDLSSKPTESVMKNNGSHHAFWFPLLAFLFFVIAVKIVFFRRHNLRNQQYESIGSPRQTTLIV